jgi:hypothetical protein
MRLSALGTATLAALLAAVPHLAAQKSTPPDKVIRKGEVVAADPRAGTLTLRGSRGNDVLQVLSAARGTLGDLRAGDYVEARLDKLDRVERFLRVTKKPRAAREGGPAATASANLTVMADAACRLLLNAREVGATKPVPGSEKEHRAELALAPGSYLLKAVTPDGREWESEVKPGREMQTVRIAFPPPPATAAEFDAAAAQAWMALRDARTVGRAVDVALDGSFAYYDFDMGLVFAAQDAVKRATAALPAAAPSDGARKAAAEELKRAATEAGSYLGILAEAVDTAIKESRSGKGSAARGVHAKAQALESRMVADSAKLAAVQDTSAFKGALPPDRQAEVGGPRPAQDLELGADYCHCRPAVVAVVDKGGLAERQLKLEPGDVLRSADGKPLASLWDLKVALRAAAGRKLKLAIERDGRAREIEVKAPAAP